MNEQAARLLYVRLGLKPGDLVFDIGAHVGTHTAGFLSYGCRVVAVEPQPDKLEQVPRSLDVIRVCAAVSAEVGETTLYLCPDHSYVTTVDPAYTEKVQTHASYDYERQVRVPTTTLDALIDAYGLPAFVKVDVEGHEDKVLQGLTTALPALSFEVHDFDVPKAKRCVARLAELGDYDLWYSAREDFALTHWPPERYDIFGDVYARRRP